MLAFEAPRSKQPYFQPMMDPNLDMYSYSMDGMQQYAQNIDYSQSYFDAPLYAETEMMQKYSEFPSMPATPPSIATSHATEQQIPTGSAASGPSIASAASSATGSPYSGPASVFQDNNWLNTNHGLGLPAAVMHDIFPNEYMGGNPADMDGYYREKLPDHSVDSVQLTSNAADPSLLIQSLPGNTLMPTISYPDQNSTYSTVPQNYLPCSPATSPVPYSDNVEQHSPGLHSVPHPSPLMMNSGFHSRPASVYDRRSSISSIQSRRSQQSPALSSIEGDDIKEKGQCPHPECGRIFKDLKAHMLTHQSERPEKCPITNCEYHTKGFARKYDKNRHTLTHYKGTMVCGFCPGSGSSAEKSFNRADVFKRHLTSLHGVEQTAPNCRKRSPSTSTKKGTNYSSDATGKCSTCSATFSNAQDFYEHLDDCVLRVVQQEEPSEAINQHHLADISSDEDVKKTMEKHQLLDTTAGSVEQYDDEDSHDDNDSYDLANWRATGRASKSKASSRAIIGNGNAITKHSSSSTAPGKAPRAVVTRRRNNRGNYPQSWGCPSSNMKSKKRVLCVFNGQRRLWKDEMLLNNEFEVRMPLPGGAGDGTNRQAYVTDLDVETLKRAEGVLSATDEERGPWLDGPSTHLMGQPARLIPDMFQHDDELSFNDLMG
ncbi:hypothetical protein N7466_003116 [Penicillium verhagenii]|uniref:uncharacterized protein n=1 Tax=Penicillium verhagenii TaxID=1562060 RepID=UPI002544ED58|nr:uncharacterized protein N7466_003116 [Penicillium verhagenii]KAJ5936666.1 hypothetical protein N7466_003116 [Penicillium verhagenii]